MEKTKIIQKTHLFENITEESRKNLAAICLDKTINKKEILFMEGDKGYSLYILVDGNIQLFKTTPEGREVVIKVIKPGEIFGEVILFEEDRYPVSAVALKKSRVYLIPKHQFTCLLGNELFRNDFIKTLMKKMRYLTRQIRYLTNHDVEERLFMFLNEQFGDSKQINISLSKKDVANAIGATPETLSRLLLRLKSDNRLIWEGNTIEISSFAGVPAPAEQKIVYNKGRTTH